MIFFAIGVFKTKEQFGEYNIVENAPTTTTTTNNKSSEMPYESIDKELMRI